MKKFFIQLMVVCLPCASVAAQASSAAQQLMARLQPMSSMRADFAQTTRLGGGQTAVAKGFFILQRPGHFYWQVNQPGKQIIVINGRQLMVYDVDLAQVTKQTLSDQSQALNPVSLLSGHLKSLVQNNRVSSKQHNGVTTYRLDPIYAGGSIKWLALSFCGSHLTGMQMVNQMGQLTAFQFSHLQLNPSLKPSQFQIKIPKDVDVVTPG